LQATTKRTQTFSSLLADPKQQFHKHFEQQFHLNTKIYTPLSYQPLTSN